MPNLDLVYYPFRHLAGECVILDEFAFFLIRGIFPHTFTPLLPSLHKLPLTSARGFPRIYVMVPLDLAGLIQPFLMAVDLFFPLLFFFARRIERFVISNRRKIGRIIFNYFIICFYQNYLFYFEEF